MSEQSKRKALVTGASGFIGSHLVRHLHNAGWHVEVIARTSASQRLGESSTIARVHLYSGATQEVVDAVAAAQPSIVFHLASLFLASHDATQVEPLISSNILFGAQLLEAMKFAGVTRLVNAGTAWQNYDGDQFNPVNLYAATKQAFEDIALYYVRTAGLRMTTLRLYDSYGPGDTRRKLLRLLLDCLRTGEPLGMSPGEQIIDLVHVEDLCRAFLRAAELVQQNPEAGADVYAISGGERRSLREIAVVVESVAGRKLPLTFGARPYREREVMVPWSGPALPGWKPQVMLEEGIRKLLAE